MVEEVDVDIPIHESGITMLHVACFYGHLDRINLLIDLGADINKQCKHGWTSLHRACNCGNFEVVKLLLDRGADVNLQTIHGKRAIDFSSSVIKDYILSYENNLDIKEPDLY